MSLMLWIRYSLLSWSRPYYFLFLYRVNLPNLLSMLGIVGLCYLIKIILLLGRFQLICLINLSLLKGLNDDIICVVHKVDGFLLHNNVDCCAILETHVKAHHAGFMFNLFLTYYSRVDNYNAHYKDRIGFCGTIV
ncbi:hypothetical protein KSS87_011962 [Heliosperma pusillum]|nr:hypothetical protein KSS87_011962 [Heliosperma pusillum]